MGDDLPLEGEMYLNKDKIEIGVRQYYIPNRWSGSCSKVTVNRFINDDLAEVVASKGRPFQIGIKHIYKSDKAAISGFQAFERELKNLKQKDNKPKTNLCNADTNQTTISPYDQEKLRLIIKNALCSDWKVRLQALEKLKDISDLTAKNQIRQMAQHDEATAVRRVACNIANQYDIRVKDHTIKLRHLRPLEQLPQMKSFKKNLKAVSDDFKKRDEIPSIGIFVKAFRELAPNQYDLISGRHIRDSNILKFFKSKCAFLEIPILPKTKSNLNGEVSAPVEFTENTAQPA